MREPVLSINCRSCGTRTEHVLSKNVTKEFVYICLKCGQETAMRQAEDETMKIWEYSQGD